MNGHSIAFANALWGGENLGREHSVAFSPRILTQSPHQIDGSLVRPWPQLLGSELRFQTMSNRFTQAIASFAASGTATPEEQSPAVIFPLPGQHAMDHSGSINPRLNRLSRLMNRNQCPGFVTALSRRDYYIVILCCFDGPFAHDPANLDNRHAAFDCSHH